MIAKVELHQTCSTVLNSKLSREDSKQMTFRSSNHDQQMCGMGGGYCRHQTDFLFSSVCVLYVFYPFQGGRKKKLDFLYMSPTMGGGVDPLQLKRVDFFQTKCKKYSACPEYFFLLKPFFCKVDFLVTLFLLSRLITQK